MSVLQLFPKILRRLRAPRVRVMMATATLCAAAFFYISSGHATDELDPENTLIMELKDGRVTIQMFPEVAPRHVARIKELTRQGFYDGLKFHRVIEGFMAQVGDPTGTGAGGSGKLLDAEFSDAPHVRGTVSMARRPDSPNTADSQFFICFDDARFLDGEYTVWGKVIEGMDVVDKIKKGSREQNGTVENPDVIVRMVVATDEIKKADDAEKKEGDAAPANDNAEDAPATENEGGEKTAPAVAQ